MRVVRHVFAAVLLLGAMSDLGAQGPNLEAKLIVAPHEIKLEPGQGQQFEVLLFSANGSPMRVENVHWSVVPDDAGKISEDGFFVAGRENGEAQIIAAVGVANNAVLSGEARVVIGKSSGSDRVKIVVEPLDAVVPPGESQQYSATVVTAAGEHQAEHVRWEVHPKHLGKISETGLFTAGREMGQGSIIAYVPVEGVVHRGATRVTVAPAPSASIAGQVIDQQSGLAIEKAVVVAEYILARIHFSRRVETDASGNYVIGELIPGLYVVKAEARGYLPEFYNDKSRFEEATPVQLAENENKPGVNFSLSQGATISGLVGTEGDKTPLPGAHVTAILVLRPDIKRHTLADDQGNFSLSGLPSGTYAVHAEAAGYKGEFYDNAQSLQQATLISAQAPETFSGVEIYLAMASAIAGRVTDFASGDAIAKALVSIHSFPSTAKRPRFVRAVHTNDNGEYIANVPPGEYLVAAEARGYHKEFYDGVRDINAATRVEVLENQHKTGIDFLMDKLSSISGQVTAEGAGTPIAGAVVTAFPERSTTDALISLDDLHRPFSAKTGPDGNYKIENLPGGNYIVTADAEEYLREFWDNSPTLEGATAVEVPEAGAKENINFTLEKGGAISGTVFAAAETPTPLPGAIVQVWQKGSNAAIARTKTQRDGTYRIGGLPTGEYLVFAKAEGFKGVFYDDKESRDQADAVNVAAPNETGDINFNLKKIETRGATIAGVVISEVDKNPIPHALILVIPLRVAPIPISSLFTIANEFGHYRLPGLPPGKYVAVACAPRFICEFYDNASHFSKATIIGLESGTVREDIHFSLLPARHGPYRITGRVRHGRDNRGAENTLVQAIEAGTVASTAVTNADGSFTLDELPAGEYKIFATGELGAAFFGGANEQTATSVTVGNGQNVSNIEVSLPDTPTSVDESSNQIPTRFALEPNYPNPFNPETSIKYQLPARTLVILRIYNALGQEVRTLVDGLQDAGSYATQWDGKDNKGRPLSAGIYLMRLEAGEFTMTRKMAMVK